MKKFASFLLAAVALAFSAGSFAAPGATVDTGGVSVNGFSPVVAVEKSAGNVTRLKYQGSGVWFNVQDDATGTRYNKAVVSFGSNGVAVPGSATSRVYDISKASQILCQSSQSVVAWPNIGTPDYLGDGCAFWQAAKTAAAAP